MRREVLAAALLPDAGKVEARLGTFARAGVTLAAILAGRKRLLIYSDGGVAGGLRRRVVLYLARDQLSIRLLCQVGSEDLTASWAEKHHLPPDVWALDARVAGALKAVDRD